MPCPALKGCPCCDKEYAWDHVCGVVQTVVMLKSGLLLQEGDDFRTAADRYVRHFLSRGIPSLFSDLKGFYR